MSVDPIERLPIAFGKVLARKWRDESHFTTAEQFSAAVGLPVKDVIKMVSGKREPTITEFCKIARMLREEPGILLIELIAEWREYDATPIYRASDFVRLYRLGYHHKPGDFREQDRTYGSIPAVIDAAATLNQQRYKRRVRLLDTCCIYIRMKHIGFEWTPDATEVES